MSETMITSRLHIEFNRERKGENTPENCLYGNLDYETSVKNCSTNLGLKNFSFIVTVWDCIASELTGTRLQHRTFSQPDGRPFPGESILYYPGCNPKKLHLCQPDFLNVYFYVFTSRTNAHILQKKAI